MLVDYVADDWAVVLEREVKDLETFSHAMQAWALRPEMLDATGTHLANVESGRREVFRIYEPVA